MHEEFASQLMGTFSGGPLAYTPKTNGVSKNGAKPRAKDWKHRYSFESLSQAPSPLKESAKTLDVSKTIPLGTARPNPQYYPWHSMTMNVTGDEPGSYSTRNALKMSCNKGGAGLDLSAILNYGHSSGSPELIGYFTEHVRRIHNPQYQDWETCLTCGSTSAIEIAFRMFVNRGDYIMTEAYTYAGTTTAATAQGLKILGIEMDDGGLIPEDLDSKLCNWDTSKGRKPYLLYTIPSGQNPSATTQSTERKKAVYKVAEKHDLVIVEDDPYFFLPLGDRASTTGQLTAEEFQDSLPASYLSLDTCGRVLRLDTASKILAPGLRCGWATGCAQIIDMFVAEAEVSTLGPSGASQVMLYKLLNDTWGHEGLMNWLVTLSSKYRRRRDLMADACDKYLPTNICQWTVPDVGMFLWLRIDASKHPSEPQAVDAIEDRIAEMAEEKGVLVARGSWFAVEKSEKEVFLRITFAAAEEELLEKAIQQLAEVLRAEFGL